jgi:acyl-CoA thioesterase-1
MLVAIACGRSTAAPEDSRGAEPGESAPASARSASEELRRDKPLPTLAPRIVVLGDSLTAGLGIPREEAYPAILQKKLKDAGHDLEVVNAGVSGDTTADGLRRLGWALEGNVRLLVVALGANDGLRGLPPQQMRDNLRRIIERGKQRGIPVLLAGMEAPPNYGEQYASAFRQVFRDLARENKVRFVPFLLEGVAGVPSLNQGDGLHPTSAGAARIADHLWPAVEAMVTQ